MRFPRGEIPEVVETAFADRYALGLLDEFTDQRVALVGVVLGMMWVHPRRGEERTWMLPRQFQRASIAVVAASRDDEPANAHSACALEHRVPIIVKAVVGEIRANVDKFVRHYT